MHEILNRSGKIVGLLFNKQLNTNQPPFGGNKDDYTGYFKPYFDIEIMNACYNSVPSRKDKELFIKLIKK